MKALFEHLSLYFPRRYYAKQKKRFVSWFSEWIRSEGRTDLNVQAEKSSLFVKRMEQSNKLIVSTFNTPERFVMGRQLQTATSLRRTLIAMMVMKIAVLVLFVGAIFFVYHFYSDGNIALSVLGSVMATVFYLLMLGIPKGYNFSYNATLATVACSFLRDIETDLLLMDSPFLDTEDIVHAFPQYQYYLVVDNIYQSPTIWNNCRNMNGKVVTHYTSVVDANGDKSTFLNPFSFRDSTRPKRLYESVWEID